MNFDHEVQVILKHEGGYVDDELDPGGETNRGITIKVWKKHFSKPLIEQTELEAIKIYKVDYYNPNRCGKIHDPAIRIQFFDIMVNTGNAKILQRAVNRVSKNKLNIDGVIGDMTIGSVNAQEDVKALNHWLYVERMAHYDAIRKHNKNLKKFMWIWVNRSLSFIY